MTNIIVSDQIEFEFQEFLNTTVLLSKVKSSIFFVYLSFKEKNVCISTSNSIYHIPISDGLSKPIRRGTVHWNEKAQFENYVDVLFIQNAMFAQQEN